jgi:hypothetical protein
LVAFFDEHYVSWDMCQDVLKAIRQGRKCHDVQDRRIVAENSPLASALTSFSATVMAFLKAITQRVWTREPYAWMSRKLGLSNAHKVWSSTETGTPLLTGPLYAPLPLKCRPQLLTLGGLAHAGEQLNHNKHLLYVVRINFIGSLADALLRQVAAHLLI